MKTIYVFVCLILSVQFLYGQEQAPEEFEGYIEFTHNISSPDSSFDVKRAQSTYGTSSVYYYKNGHYRWVFNGCKNLKGTEVILEIYNPIRNEVYVARTGAPPEIGSANSGPSFKVLAHKFLFNKEVLAGFPCYQYYIETASERTNVKRVFSYSDKLPLNPEHFKHFTGNNFDFIYPKLKAIPLKISMVLDNYFLMEYVATKVVAQKIDPAIFEFKQP